MNVGTGILIQAVWHKSPEAFALGWGGKDWVHSNVMTKHDYCKIGSGFPKASDEG